jgi:uncharacterized sporulation protein YeaH/YhbH (DUF444 family)
MQILDRRLNPGDGSLGNRQRFLRRARALVRDAVRNATATGGMTDTGEAGGEVTIPAAGVHEPSFRRSPRGGQRSVVLPGNKEFLEGDRLPRPRGGGSGGGGSQGSPDGEGEDSFRFALTRSEFLDLFLEDLELPDMARRGLAEVEGTAHHHAGYATTGPAAALALTRSMRTGLARRIALRRPSAAALEALEAELADAEARGAPEEEIAERRAVLARQQNRLRVVPWLDPLDLRYRRQERIPLPVSQAVMFCLMDVSGSMTEGMKDLAKRFFMLLNIFLRTRYKRVEVVFIRHTHEAQEVDEETFFRSPETGGTVVSSAFEVMAEALATRYPAEQWNIYAAQASDGENTPSDNARVAALLTETLLPVCRHFAYLEVGGDVLLPPGLAGRDSELWRSYATLRGAGAPIAMRRVRHRRDIYPVFRDLFRKDQSAREGAAQAGTP